jgi:hypothetical protein
VSYPGIVPVLQKMNYLALFLALNYSSSLLCLKNIAALVYVGMITFMLSINLFT